MLSLSCSFPQVRVTRLASAQVREGLGPTPLPFGMTGALNIISERAGLPVVAGD